MSNEQVMNDAGDVNNERHEENHGEENTVTEDENVAETELAATGLEERTSLQETSQENVTDTPDGNEVTVDKEEEKDRTINDIEEEGEDEETTPQEGQYENGDVNKIGEEAGDTKGAVMELNEVDAEVEEDKEADENYPIIRHPDTSLVDITQIEIEEKEESYYGLFGRGLYRFPDIKDPGIDAALNYEHVQQPFDDVGTERYLYVCKALNVVPISRFLRELHGSSVNLRYYGLDPRGVRGIAEALYRNKTVKSLDLEDNWLTRDAVYHLGEMLKENTQITHLNLTGCKIGPEGAHRMKEGILLTQALKELNLSWNNLGDEGMEELAPALMDNCSIQTLILSHNNLESQTGILLGSVVLENWSIQHLDLSWNSMYGKEGMKALFTNLTLNHSVNSLNLAWNGISSGEVTKEIRAYLAKNDTIQHLDLSSNRIEGLALNMLKFGVNKNETLLSLKLGRNPLSPKDALDLLKVLQNPTTVLEILDLEDVWVHKDFLQTLEQIQRVRQCEVKIGGVYSNYKVVGPDVKKLLFDRAKYEAQKPKSKKKKKDVGHFILKMDIQQPVKKPKFVGMVEAAKMKLNENLVLEIMKNFPAPKKCVDLQAMQEYYLKLYPDTHLPAEKPKKAKKKKKGKGKKK